MRSTFRFLLLITAVLAAVISLGSFYFWGIFAYTFFTGQTAIEFARKYTPDMIANADQGKLALFRIRDYFVVIGGAYGWLSLGGLCAFANRPLILIPKWVVIGCVFGIAAALALALPSRNPLAYPPILLTVVLLLRSQLSTPLHLTNTNPPENHAES
jgi:hypothetical protein